MAFFISGRWDRKKWRLTEVTLICVWRLTDRSVSVEQEMRGTGGRLCEEVRSRGRTGRVGSKLWFFIQVKEQIG